MRKNTVSDLTMRSAEIARNIQQGMVNESDIDDLIQGVISQDGERWSDEDVVKVLQSIFQTWTRPREYRPFDFENDAKW